MNSEASAAFLSVAARSLPCGERSVLRPVSALLSVTPSLSLAKRTRMFDQHARMGIVGERHEIVLLRHGRAGAVVGPARDPTVAVDQRRVLRSALCQDTRLVVTDACNARVICLCRIRTGLDVAGAGRARQRRAAVAAGIVSFFLLEDVVQESAMRIVLLTVLWLGVGGATWADDVRDCAAPTP